MHIFLFAALFLGVMGSSTFNGRIFFPSDINDRNMLREDIVAELVQEKPPNLIMVLTGEGLERSGNDINGQLFSTRRYVEDYMPNCARSSPHAVLCEEDEEYDEDVMHHFDIAAKKANLSEDEIPEMITKILVPESGSSISSRTHEDIDTKPVCPAKEKVLFPKRGKNKDDKWVYVFNHDKVKQGVRVEECWQPARLRNLGSSSQEECSVNTAVDVESVCEQKYILKKMITMGMTGDEIVTDSIWIPSCCVCVRRKILQIP